MFIGYIIHPQHFPHTIRPHLTVIHFEHPAPDPEQMYQLDLIAEGVPPTAMVEVKGSSFFKGQSTALVDSKLIETTHDYWMTKLKKNCPDLFEKVSTDFEFTPHVTFNEPAGFDLPKKIGLTGLAIIFNGVTLTDGTIHKRTRYLGF